MTTTKESPDSGAGALLPCPFCGASITMLETQGARYGEHPRNVVCILSMYTIYPGQFAAWNTRAQDSGQGEAVAFIDAHGGLHNLAKGGESFLYGLEGITFLFTHPPKPAQDAAGKGVEDSVALASIRLAWAKYRAAQFSVIANMEFVKSIEDALADAAKPAQVGEKYREPSRAELKQMADLYEHHAAAFCCKTKEDAMSFAIRSIGAVVPAREGES